MLSSISSSTPNPSTPQTAAPLSSTHSADETSPAENTGKSIPSTSRASGSANSTAVSVNISSAAKQALQESTETPAQTAQEAGRGDVQASHLLAKEQLAKQATQNNK